jgi:hypothetical protein
MIVAYLQGGMGNTMFQYATGLAAAIRLGTDLALNTLSFVHDPMRQYSLGLWEGVTAPLTEELHGEIIREEGLPYNPRLVSKISKNCSLIGYFQTERYFKEIRGLLQNVFTPKQVMTDRDKDLERQINAAGDKSVFLTVRRTDYTKSDFHGVLSFEYYQQAINIIAEKVAPHIFVFSDEPEWCKYNLKLPYPTTIAGNYDRTTSDHLGREDSELWLMRCCKHAIMANSSYSWWGAWLGADIKGGTIVAPKRWFLNAPNEDARDIVPDRWIAI